MGDEGKLVGREGIEPPQSKTADLQSAELTTCSTYPRIRTRFRFGLPGGGARRPRALFTCGAADGTRTRNRRFTKPLLYQLSYGGATAKDTARPATPALCVVRQEIVRGRRCLLLRHAAWFQLCHRS